MFQFTKALSTLSELQIRRRLGRLVQTRHFLGSPPEKQEGKCRAATAVAQLHGGGLKSALKNTIRALHSKFGNCGHEKGACSFNQPRIAPLRQWRGTAAPRHCPPLLSRGGDSKRPISRRRLSRLKGFGALVVVVLCPFPRQGDAQPAREISAASYVERDKGLVAQGAFKLAVALQFPTTPTLAEDSLWHKLIGEAKQLREEKRYAEAEKQMLLGLAEAEKFGPEDRRLAVSLNELAALYHASLRFSEAEPVYRRALGIWKNSPTVWSKPQP